MARFNGSTAQQGGFPPAEPRETEAPAWTPEQIAAWQHQQAQNAHYAHQQHSHRAPSLPHLGQPAPGFSDLPMEQPVQPPFASHQDPLHHPVHQHPPQQAFGHPSLDAPSRAEWGAHQQYGHGQSTPAWPRQQQHAAYEPQPPSLQQPGPLPYEQHYDRQLNGHGQFPAQQAPHFAPPLYPDQPADPRAHDLHVNEVYRRDPLPHLHTGGAPAWDPQGYPGAAHAQPGFGHPASHPAHDPHGFQQPAGQHYPNGDWPPDAAFGQPHQGAAGEVRHGYQEPTFAQSLDAVAQQQEFGQTYGHDANGNPLNAEDPNQFGALDQEYEEEEAPRRPRTLIIASALVGAIVLGGGMAYGFKKYSSMSVATTAMPVVKAEKTPVKSKPADPGGREVAHTDKKFLNSLTESGNGSTQQGAPAPAQQQDDGAPRKVTTLVVRPDGTLSQGAPAATPPPAPPSTSSGVPGMVIDGGPKAPLRGPPQETAAIQQPAAPATPLRQTPVHAEQPSPPPARVAAVPSRSRTDAQIEEADPVSEETRAKAPVVKKRPPTPRDDAAAPQVTASTKPAVAPKPKAASGGAGFVTVLSSRKTREEAFSEFPDLQTKYAGVLAGKTPDVRETDLTDKGKGVVYRLIVGPPGSREEAINTCNKLKAQGYNGCWATPYN